MSNKKHKGEWKGRGMDKERGRGEKWEGRIEEYRGIRSVMERRIASENTCS